MRIDGLKATISTLPDRTKTTDFVPLNATRQGLIRLTKFPDSDAVVEFLDHSGERPDIGPGESVVITAADDVLTDRMIRALASIHLGLRELENGYTAADSRMIEEGFVIGRVHGNPVWVKTEGCLTIVLGNEDVSGLPSNPNEPATIVAFGQTDARLVFLADELETALTALDTGLITNSFQPQGNVTLVGSKGNRRLH